MKENIREKQLGISVELVYRMIDKKIKDIMDKSNPTGLNRIEKIFGFNDKEIGELDQSKYPYRGKKGKQLKSFFYSRRPVIVFAREVLKGEAKRGGLLKVDTTLGVEEIFSWHYAKDSLVQGRTGTLDPNTSFVDYVKKEGDSGPSIRVNNNNDMVYKYKIQK